MLTRMLHATELIHHSTMGLLPQLLAQTSSAADSAAAGGIGIVQIIIFIATYAFVAFCCQQIFERCGVENPWFAWIPILSTYAGLQAGDEENPLLWTILACIPCVNLVALIKIIPAWINICQKLDKTPWILLTIFIPVIGSFILFGYLTFA
jgi:hypothetical protein